MNFGQFFTTATGNAAHPQAHPPSGCQRRLALDPECQSRLIRIPSSTGNYGNWSGGVKGGTDCKY